MTELRSIASEGMDAAGAIHVANSDLPTATAVGPAGVENSTMDANDEMSEEHEIMDFCPAGVGKLAKELQPISLVVPNLTSDSASTSISAATSVPTNLLASGSRPDGLMPAIRGSKSASRTARALRCRGLAVPRRGSRIAHRRHKLFEGPKRTRRFDSEPIPSIPNSQFRPLVRQVLKNHRRGFRIQKSASSYVQEAAELLVLNLMKVNQGRDMQRCFEYMNSGGFSHKELEK